MTEAPFPSRNPDGSFCVEISLSLSGENMEDLGSRVQQWFDQQWIPGRATWEREWKTGPQMAVAQRQLLRYEDEFNGPPKIVSCECPELRFRLIGKKSARFWRDWLISRLIPELRAKFPQVGQRLSVTDCTEPSIVETAPADRRLAGAKTRRRLAWNEASRPRRNSN